MSSPVITIESDARVEDALSLMASKNVGAVVVVEGSRPVGIFTERDLVRKLTANEELSKLKVSSLMSKPLITCHPDTPILRAFTIMYENKIRRLPVVDSDKLVGIITERDLIFWVLCLIGYSQGIFNE